MNKTIYIPGNRLTGFIKSGSLLVVAVILLVVAIFAGISLLSKNSSEAPPAVMPPTAPQEPANPSLFFYDDLGEAISVESINVGDCDLRPVSARIEIGQTVKFINDSSSKIKLFIAESNNPEAKRMIRDFEIEPQKNIDMLINFKDGEGKYFYYCLVPGQGFTHGVIYAEAQS